MATTGRQRAEPLALPPAHSHPPPLGAREPKPRAGRIYVPLTYCTPFPFPNLDSWGLLVGSGTISPVPHHPRLSLSLWTEFPFGKHNSLLLSPDIRHHR